jgi:hypothetical protein
VRNNRQRHQVQELISRLSRERAQTVPEYALTLSVVSGSTVLALATTPSDSTTNAIKGVVRLFV